MIKYLDRYGRRVRKVKLYFTTIAGVEHMVALKDGDFHIIKHYDSAVGHLYTVLIGRAGRGKYKEAYECYTYHLIRLLDVDYTEVEDGE